MPEFDYSPMLPIGPDETPYRLLTTEGIDTFEAGGRTFLTVAPEVLRALTETAVHDMEHFLRPGHLAQLRSILDDPEASPNDRFVALDLLRNVNISAGGVLPMCQDTGTAIVMGKRGQQVLTSGDDERAISLGVYDAFTRLNLRYSQTPKLATRIPTSSSSWPRVVAQPTRVCSTSRPRQFLIQLLCGRSSTKTFERSARQHARPITSRS